MLRFRLDCDHITSENDVPEEVFLYKLCGTPCLPRGDLTMVTGPPKSGKTFFISMLMACAAGHRVLGLERIREEPLRVLYELFNCNQDCKSSLFTVELTFSRRFRKNRPSVCASSEVSWSGTAAWGSSCCLPRELPPLYMPSPC